MSDLCLVNTPKTPQFSSLLVSHLTLLCSFMLSHPLYFSYFIFFSPYLVKLLSFLSPLFITTSLLLLVFLTFSSPGLIQEHSSSQFSKTKLSFFLTTYHTLLERLQSEKNDECHSEDDLSCLEEFDVFKIVFDASTFDLRPSPGDVLDLTSDEESCFHDFEEPILCSSSHEGESAADKISKCEDSATKLEENCGESAPEEFSMTDAMEEKRLEIFFKELDEFENMTSNVKEKKDHEAPVAKSKKVVETTNKKEESLVEGCGSEAKIGNNKIYAALINAGTKVSSHSQRLGLGEFVNRNSHANGGEHTPKVESSKALDYNNLGSYGSMRKEKEWKRTLACKLFEERHNNNVDGSGEGMDLLWETYETDSSKTKPKSNRYTIKKKSKKKDEIKFFDYDENEETEEEEMDGQLCCLQALKLSAGKMNLGMGKPNLVRISKAFKGFGWLHHVTRHGKKVHHGDRF